MALACWDSPGTGDQICFKLTGLRHFAEFVRLTHCHVSNLVGVMSARRHNEFHHLKGSVFFAVAGSK